MFLLRDKLGKMISFRLKCIHLECQGFDLSVKVVNRLRLLQRGGAMLESCTNRRFWLDGWMIFRVM